ncbi:MAG TPA: ABC transporter ATP-binding protein [Syntrophomonadaceae bacterium]|nr:ABC transporter ATP-binding protein [Syntrophomonadaceae bacterium]
MITPLLQVSKLNVKAGKFALRGINFSINDPNYLIILGPTGCGKTMLLETIAGLRKPTAGKINLQGINITDCPPEKRGLGFAYQDSLLYPFLTVKENILFGAKARKKDKNPETVQRLHSLAEAMQIGHLLKRYPQALSGGEKQRVSLARAVLINPPILLLDEPLSALDPQTRHAMRNLLREIHLQEKIGIIHVTHDFNEALQLGSHLIVMNQGEILQEGKPIEIFNQPNSLFVANFLQCENIIKGKIKRENGSLKFVSLENNWSISPLPTHKCAKKTHNEKVYLSLHAWQIKLAPQGNIVSSNTNHWPAIIKNVIIHASHVEITCQGQGFWNINLSRNEWHELDLQVGSAVTLMINTDDVHLIYE